jgi:hypothetical protein
MLLLRPVRIAQVVMSVQREDAVIAQPVLQANTQVLTTPRASDVVQVSTVMLLLRPVQPVQLASILPQ